MRRALAGLWAILPLAVLLLTLPLLSVPEQVPTHWSGRYPDGFSSGSGFISVILSIAVVCAVVAAAGAVLRQMVPPSWSRWLVATAAAVGWAVVLIAVLTLWRVQVDGADRVREVWALVAVAGGLLAGVLGYAVHGRRRPPREEVLDQVPERSRVQATRGSTPVVPWETAVSSTTLRVVGWGVLVLLVGLGVGLGLVGQSWPILVLLVLTGVASGGLAVVWSAIRVRVDAEGLAVRSRIVPLRVMRVPAAEVVGADVQELDPMRWGGVGLRALPDRTAYIVGAGGSGLVVYQSDGRRLALQVTEGDEAARAGARTLRQAAGQRLGDASGS